MLSQMNRTRVITLSLAIVCLLLTVLTLLSPSARDHAFRKIPVWLQGSPSRDGETPLPPLWVDDLIPLTLSDVHESDFCTDRFSGSYLENLRNHGVQYCPSNSTSQITCFHTQLRDDAGHDTLCIGQGAVLDVAKGVFRLDCLPRELEANETARGLVSLHDIRSAWFDTGARTILDRYVKFESTAPSPTSLPPALPDEHEPSPQFTLMVKREGNHNFWHSLMEVFSMTLTFDTLRISRDPSTTSSGEPFFSFPRDAANTQVVLLDDQPNQPWFDLWRMFAGRDPVHLKDILADPIRAREFAHSRRNIILPLPGGSNPLWHNDWIVRSCRHAPLLRLFVRRVVAHAGLEFQTGPRPTSDDDAQDIRLTFLHRGGSRRLLGEDTLLEAVRARYPRVHVAAVDMGRLSLTEQLRTIQETDVLVGVHGAGLTHTMFMREGAGAVVEIQPQGFFHKGFRNLAAMTGQKYFSTHAEMVDEAEDEQPTKNEEEHGKGKKEQPAEETMIGKGRRRREEKLEWQSAAVRIAEDRFLELIDAAVKSLYNEGLRSHDVV